ncbi:MAG: hypothetical protein NUV65_01370 [Candidatus Roizmanbacteria bacterium]|nr:hypothetical protein [Candidatus Roizmanbacteria bacterium]
MLATFIIGFREFLEAFLIAGVFLGMSRKLKLKKEFEIGLAVAVGICISLTLVVAMFFFSEQARSVFSQRNTELLESYLMIFSGFFIAYVIFSLHSLFHKHNGGTILQAHKKLQAQAFDMTLFTTIVFLILREGVEIALFTASTSLFSQFSQNVLGLCIAFISAALVGMGTFAAYIKIPIGKIFRVTEYMIVLLGASMVQNGITELLEHQWGINIENIFSFGWHFLPGKETIAGHFLQSFLGIDSAMSLPRLVIMVTYIGVVYVLFLRKKLTS